MSSDFKEFELADLIMKQKEILSLETKIENLIISVANIDGKLKKLQEVRERHMGHLEQCRKEKEILENSVNPAITKEKYKDVQDAKHQKPLEKEIEILQNSLIPTTKYKETQDVKQPKSLKKDKEILPDTTFRATRDTDEVVQVRMQHEQLENENCLEEITYHVEENMEKWAKENFDWSSRLRKTMKRVFHMKEFRPQQLQTINCVMAKKDVIMIAPTGGGKSLCYQLPAIVNEGLTIVVSPLISLMEDQVWSLQKFSVKAELLASNSDPTKNKKIIKELAEWKETSSFKILYVTPERMAKSKQFMNALQKCYLAKKLHMIAIDEVHCISQFGNDFRPDYKFLGSLKITFPDVPLLGVTATATTKVIADIHQMLLLPRPTIIKAEFNRPNLYYHVMERPEKEPCIDLLHNLLVTRYANQSGIIYTFSINDTEEISKELHDRGLKVLPYHAQLPNERRTLVHSQWLSGEIQAVVATVAFGMGIDKPDVRFVIHHTMSKSMENYYQESGRAGRDGKRAECILMFRVFDLTRITSVVFTEHTGLANAHRMANFATDSISCRRDLISRHFLDVWSESAECNQMCDRCYHKDSPNPPKMDITQHCKGLYKIIEHATELKINLTALKLIEAWYQKGGSPNLRVKDVAVPDFERFYGEQIVAFLIIKGYLKEDFSFSAYKSFTYIKKGKHKGERITFFGSRVLTLPELGHREPPGINGREYNNLSESEPSTSRANDVVQLTDSEGPPTRKVKKKRESNERDRINMSESESSTSRTNNVTQLTDSEGPPTRNVKKKRESNGRNRNNLSKSEPSTSRANDVVQLTDLEGSPTRKIKKKRESNERDRSNMSKSKPNTSRNDGVVQLTDSEGPPAKKSKKEKKTKRRDRSSLSERDSDTSRANSSSDSSSKKEKKRKHEKKRRSEVDASHSDDTDDCVILVDGSDVIEID